MKIKNRKNIALLILVFAVFSMAFTVRQALTLPDEIVQFLNGLLVLAFTALGKWVFGKIGIDIQDNLAKISSAVAALVVILLNHFLTLVPTSYENLLSAVFAFLVALLAGNGAYSLFFRKKKEA